MLCRDLCLLTLLYFDALRRKGERMSVIVFVQSVKIKTSFNE